MRLSKRTVDAAGPESAERIVWDSNLPGFGLRVQPSGTKTFVVKYRVGGGRGAKQRKLTLGRYGVLTVDQAREKAKNMLAAARLGQDQGAGLRADRKGVATVSDLIDLWEKEAASLDRRSGRTRKPASVAGDVGRVRAQAIPLLGKRMLADLTKADIERFRDGVAAGKTAARKKTKARGVQRVRGGKGTAARTVRVLASIFAFAEERGLMRHNPARGVRLEPGRKIERFLSADEMSRLGQALSAAEQAEAVPEQAMTIIRLLALTGARRGEIEQLLWSAVDLERGFLHLADSKTGKKAIPLSAPAALILSNVPRQAESPWVFPATRGDGPFTATSPAWTKIRSAAGLDGVRLHDLRHSFASVGAAGGFGLPVIGAVLGHTQASTTQRYAHLAADPVKAAADRIGGLIAAQMTAKPKRASHGQ